MNANPFSTRVREAKRLSLRLFKLPLCLSTQLCEDIKFKWLSSMRMRTSLRFLSCWTKHRKLSSHTMQARLNSKRFFWITVIGASLKSYLMRRRFNSLKRICTRSMIFWQEPSYGERSSTWFEMGNCRRKNTWAFSSRRFQMRLPIQLLIRN